MPETEIKGPKLEEEEEAAERRKRALKWARDPKSWGEQITRAVCKRCKGQCCYLSTVVLDREAAERTLYKYAGYYNYDLKHHARVLMDLGRKNTMAPTLNRREDGSCIFFDREERTCEVYEDRPAACRVFFCGRGTRNKFTWIRIKEMERHVIDRRKNKEAKLKADKDTWSPDREMPMLDAILSGEKLWDSGAPSLIQKNEMKKVAKAIKEEHEYLLEHEPTDQFHACVLLGAYNVIKGAISRKKARKP